MKRLLIITAAVGAILLFLLASAGANTSLFAHNYSILLGLNILLAVCLAVLVGFQLHRLREEYRHRVFGSRLKLKLIGMFLVLAVGPGTVIYLVSVQFAVRSIESWYNVKIDSTLNSGIELGRNALDALLEQLSDRARNMALDMGDSSTPPGYPTLSKARDQLNADEVSLLSSSGRIITSVGNTDGKLQPDGLSSALLRQARLGRGYRTIEGEGVNLVLHVVVPIPSRQFSAPLLLQVRAPVPGPLAESAESIQELHRNYQELLLARQGLKRIYVITLTLALLLAVFTAMGLAFVFARSFSAPLAILAEGTQAVAAGDFTPRQALPARDELGVLTQSFNRMTRQLQDARQQADQHRSAVDTARAYLESVLGNLSAGVLAFSPDGILKAANRGAMTILREDLTKFESRALAEWAEHTTFRDAVLSGFAEHDEDWQKQIEIQLGEGHTQTLLLHGSRLPETSGGGFVIVSDDITELLSAQRNAAWAEVARRLAHEIKNPLTPIQLSAERLQHKLADKLDEQDRNMLARSTQTIVNQVEAMKNLVNSFRDYAKLPPPKLVALDLNALLREVLVLYEGSRIPVTADFGAELPDVKADASQLRQVIHNLLQNAQDAVAEHADPRISVLTRREGRRIELIVRDNGTGFPPAIISRALEPYVTTKPRGSGLGLAIVRKIMDEHRGDISLGNRADGGAEVKIRLRLATPNTADSGAKSDATA